MGIEGWEPYELDLAWLSSWEGEETGALVRGERDEPCGTRSAPQPPRSTSWNHIPFGLSVV